MKNKMKEGGYSSLPLSCHPPFSVHLGLLLPHVGEVTDHNRFPAFLRFSWPCAAQPINSPFSFPPSGLEACQAKSLFLGVCVCLLQVCV